MFKNIGIAITAGCTLGSWFGRETVKAWFFDKVVHQVKPWEMYFVEYGIPALFAIICVWLLGYGKFWNKKKAVKSASPESLYRMPIIEILRMAIESPKVSKASHDQWIIWFLRDIQQACSKNVITMWGRERKSTDRELNASRPLIKIPEYHWKDFRIDLMSLYEYPNSNPSGYPTADNFRTRTNSLRNNREDETFVDLHVDEAQASKWFSAWQPRFS